MLHLPSQIAAIGYAANAFCGERKHHWLKGQAERKFRGYERAVATEMLSTCISEWQARGPLPPPRLVSPAASPDGAAIWAEIFGPCACEAATAAELECGGARRGDLLRLQGGEVGWASGFWRVEHAGGSQLFACLEALPPTGPDTYAAGPAAETLRPLSEAASLLAAARIGDFDRGWAREAQRACGAWAPAASPAGFGLLLALAVAFGRRDAGANLHQGRGRAHALPAAERRLAGAARAGVSLRGGKCLPCLRMAAGRPPRRARGDLAHTTRDLGTLAPTRSWSGPISDRGDLGPARPRHA